MTTGEIIGAALVAAPFVLITGVMIQQSGWRSALATWAISLTLGGSIVAGVFLLIPQ